MKKYVHNQYISRKCLSFHFLACYASFFISTYFTHFIFSLIFNIFLTSPIQITLPDGKVVQGESWRTTPYEVAKSIRLVGRRGGDVNAYSDGGREFFLGCIISEFKCTYQFIHTLFNFSPLFYSPLLLYIYPPHPFQQSRFSRCSSDIKGEW